MLFMKYMEPAKGMFDKLHVIKSMKPLKRMFDKLHVNIPDSCNLIKTSLFAKKTISIIMFN